MRKMIAPITIVLVLGGAAFGWWFLQHQPVSTQKNEPTPSASKNEKSSNPNEHSYMDVDFARKMIVHNQQGIQMADIAKINASSEEIRQLATRISGELSSETAQYINWLTEWKETYFNLSDFPQMDGHDMYPTHPGMASLADLSALKSASGSSVDDLFLRLIIAHHEGAAEMANGVEFEKMQFGKIISLKNETLEKQAEEIRTLKQLQTKGE